jgi:cell division protein FtsB
MPSTSVFSGQKFRRDHEPTILRHNRTRLFWLCLGLFWMLLISQVVWGRHGLLQWWRAEQAVAERANEIQLAQARVERMKVRNDAVQTDSEIQEEIARELHGYTRPGAIVFEFDDAKEWSIQSR